MRQSVGMMKNMPLEQILATNIAALMARTVGLDTIEKLALRSGVGRGTVDRIKKHEVSTKLETVEKLADAFGLPPLTLLTAPGSDAVEPIALPPIAQDDSATRLDRLSGDEDYLVQTFRAMGAKERAQVLEIIDVVARTSRAAANEPQ